MHWIEEWRLAHDISQGKLAAMTNCSRLTIDRLENEEGYMTHHKIAAKIAEVTGATAEQYDSIVTEAHRGEYKPPAAVRRKTRGQAKAALPRTGADQAAAEAKPVKPKKIRQIVKIDRNAKEVCRYDRLYTAAAAEEASSETIKKRCKRRYGSQHLEFGSGNRRYTYRYGDEWDAMTEEERRKDIGADHEA